MSLDTSKIVLVDFPVDQYYPKETQKNQIVLHHTVSNPHSSQGDVDYWLSTPERVATHFIVEFDGSIKQCYSSKFWGHHLGIKPEFLRNQGFKDYVSRNALLNERSIAIEIDSWGALIKKSDGYYNAYGKKLNDSRLEIVEFDKPYRDYKYYQKYSNAQISTLVDLIKYMCDKYKIPVAGLPKTLNFEVDMNALSGVPGIYSHSNYRSDKNDVIPQTELINALKNL